MRLATCEIVMGSRSLSITMFRIYDPANTKEKDIIVDLFEGLAGC